MPIFVITTHQATNENDSKNYIEFQKNNDVKKGATILKTAVQDTTINGFKFYSMTIDEIDNFRARLKVCAFNPTRKAPKR